MGLPLGTPVGTYLGFASPAGFLGRPRGFPDGTYDFFGTLSFSSLYQWCAFPFFIFAILLAGCVFLVQGLRVFCPTTFWREYFYRSFTGIFWREYYFADPHTYQGSFDWRGRGVFELTANQPGEKTRFMKLVVLKV